MSLAVTWLAPAKADAIEHAALPLPMSKTVLLFTYWPLSNINLNWNVLYKNTQTYSSKFVSPGNSLTAGPIKCPEWIVKLALVCRQMPQFALFCYQMQLYFWSQVIRTHNSSIFNLCGIKLFTPIAIIFYNSFHRVYNILGEPEVHFGQNQNIWTTF